MYCSFLGIIYNYFVNLSWDIIDIWYNNFDSSIRHSQESNFYKHLNLDSIYHNIRNISSDYYNNSYILQGILSFIHLYKLSQINIFYNYLNHRIKGILIYIFGKFHHHLQMLQFGIVSIYSGYFHNTLDSQLGKKHIGFDYFVWREYTLLCILHKWGFFLRSKRHNL